MSSAHRSSIYATEREGGEPAAPVRARVLQAAMPRRSQPLLVRRYTPVQLRMKLTVSQSNRHAREIVDMSVLSAAKRSPTALQGHLGRADSPGAAFEQHHDRVPALATGPVGPHLFVRRGYLPGGG